ncbi:MAG: hypothetical protein ACPIOQ_69265, partial [Promethearchaeia archaeon]
LCICKPMYVCVDHVCVCLCVYNIHHVYLYTKQARHDSLLAAIAHASASPMASQGNEGQAMQRL